MQKKLLIGLIASLCIESALADSFSCEGDELQVKSSSCSLQAKSSDCLLPKDGTCLNRETYITLGIKEWLEFLYRKNSRIVSGPYSDEKAIKEQGLLETLVERLLKLLGKRAPTSCGVWEINTLQDRAFCFESSLELNLCRVDTRYTDTLIIKKKNGDFCYQSNWRYGENNRLKTWPLETCPISDGAVYRIIMRGKKHKLTFHQVPHTLTGNYQTSWMVGKRCIRQAGIRWPVSK